LPGSVEGRLRPDNLQFVAFALNPRRAGLGLTQIQSMPGAVAIVPLVSHCDLETAAACSAPRSARHQPAQWFATGHDDETGAVAGRPLRI
jgi:hypothetical protein